MLVSSFLSGLKEWLIDEMGLRVWELESLQYSKYASWNLEFSFVRWKNTRKSLIGNCTVQELELPWLKRPPGYRTRDEYNKPIPISVGKINMGRKLTKDLYDKSIKR